MSKTGTSEFSKIDNGLFRALRAFESCCDKSGLGHGISVRLHFDGDLSPIESLGFETNSTDGNQASGVIRFDAVREIISHPNVVWIAAGERPQMNLDKATVDIRARASTSGNVGGGGDGLWHVSSANGAISQAGNATGNGVIVAVIDTGIDYKHPSFMSQFSPFRSRIMSIWDQGLVPANVNECPDSALLESSQTYGVEYKTTQIDAALNGGTGLNHKDCIGHGTHVACIAAGGSKLPSGSGAQFVGVAPEADIIAVKLLDNPDTIRFRTSGGPAGQVGAEDRFKDAVMYCLRSAKAALPNPKPVVINMSFGNSAFPGDGLDSEALWLDTILDPAATAGQSRFPKGAIVVKAAGNDGDASKRQTARVTVPAGGEVIVPVKLVDARGSQQTRFLNCKNKLFKPDISMEFWYTRPVPHDTIRFSVKLPHMAAFSTEMGHGGFLDRGFVIRPGPVTVPVTAANHVHSVFVRFLAPPEVPHPSGGTVRRHNITFSLQPKHSSGTVTYYEAIYELKVRNTGAQPAVFFVMCGVQSWGCKKGVKFEIAPALEDMTPISSNVDVSSTQSITDAAGKHAVTVAAYDDTNGVTGDADHHAVASFSSWGPLRDFSQPPLSKPLVADKPEVAAPGVKINAALSIHANAPTALCHPDWAAGSRFVQHGGTSMSAPMVAGLVALLLDKKPDLKTLDVINLLKAPATTRPGSRPTAPSTDHTNAFGSGRVDAKESHENTP